MNINPRPDLITRKRTNAILLCFLFCFEHCLSLSVQIMSQLGIICLQMKGNATFSISKYRIYCIYFLGTTETDHMTLPFEKITSKSPLSFSNILMSLFILLSSFKTGMIIDTIFLSLNINNEQL